MGKLIRRGPRRTGSVLDLDRYAYGSVVGGRIEGEPVESVWKIEEPRGEKQGAKRQRDVLESSEEEHSSPVGRQSTRRAKIQAVVYMSESEESFSSSEDSDVWSAAETSESDASSASAPSDSVIRVDKVLARRKEGRREEFLVKFQNESYCKVRWITSAEYPLEEIKMNNFARRERNQQLRPEYYSDAVYFNPDYVIPDRILFHDQEDDTYLVKWRGQHYDESTWERHDDIPNVEEHLEAYRAREHPLRKDVADRKAYKPFQESPSFKGGNTLRSYQLEGLNWLAFSWHKSRNSILADEMGLGKTMQSIAFLWYLHEYQCLNGPFLVIVPLSTIQNWKREIEKWTSLNVVVYIGNAASRALIRDYELVHDATGRCKPHIVLTTYEAMSRDVGHFDAIVWESLVVDEAHRLKNKESQIFQKLNSLKFKHCLLLTGTPLQNNVQELWNLLHFLEPRVFPSMDEFTAKIGALESADQVSKLHAILKPYMLRRVKEDVEDSLKAKEETVVEVELTRIQKKYYRAVYEQNMGILSQSKSNKSAIKLNNVAMQLRHVCNHPFQIPSLEDLETRSNMSKDEVMQTLIEASGKLMLLDKLLPKLKAEGHKVLLFSQFTGMLDILDDYLAFKGYAYERIDGNVAGEKRQEAIDRYSKDASDTFAFLLTTRAGGVGINLIAADTVILYDSDWNPQQDLQAMARCHRIGQTQQVSIYRLVTRGTYESEMLRIANRKLGLDHAVLSSMEFGTKRKKPGKSEIETLLKYGAYHILQEDDDAPSLYAEGIDQILAKASHRVQHGEDKGLSLFSKASFVSNSTDLDIDINDPEFWDKMGLKKHEEEIEVLDRRDRSAKCRSNDDDYDVAEVEDEVETRVEAKVDPQVLECPGAFQVMSRKQRSVFEKLLLRYGYGRWTAIADAAGEDLHAFSTDALASFGLAYMCSLLGSKAGLKKSNRLGLHVFWKDVQHQLGVDASVDEAIGMNTAHLRLLLERGQTELSFKTSRYAKRLEREAGANIMTLRRASELDAFLSTSMAAVPVWQAGHDAARFDEAAMPAAWNALCDRDLLVGVHKHGMDAYTAVYKDVELCLHTISSWPTVAVLNKRVRQLVSKLVRPQLQQYLKATSEWATAMVDKILAYVEQFPFDRDSKRLGAVRALAKSIGSTMETSRVQRLVKHVFTALEECVDTSVSCVTLVDPDCVDAIAKVHREPAAAQELLHRNSILTRMVKVTSYSSLRRLLEAEDAPACLAWPKALGSGDLVSLMQGVRDHGMGQWQAMKTKNKTAMFSDCTVAPSQINARVMSYLETAVTTLEPMIADKAQQRKRSKPNPVVDLTLENAEPNCVIDTTKHAQTTLQSFFSKQ